MWGWIQPVIKKAPAFREVYRTKGGRVIWILETDKSWAGYWWDVDSFPDLGLAQEIFIKNVGVESSPRTNKTKGQTKCEKQNQDR
jgi:hypothetical protein